MTKNDLKYYSSLLQKKYRLKYGKFLIEGKRLVEEAVKSIYPIDSVFVTESFLERNRNYYEALPDEISVENIKDSEMDKLTGTKNPQGIAAVCKFINKPNTEFESSNIIIALENISDPGNLGTIIRNCDWFGIDSIIVSPDCADLFNPKTLRSTMGSIFHVDITGVVNFYETLELLKKKNFKLITADLNGKNVSEYNFELKSVIVFANEAKGPSGEIKNLADAFVTIPKYGNAESLNVASASAVILSHLAEYK